MKERGKKKSPTCVILCDSKSEKVKMLRVVHAAECWLVITNESRGLNRKTDFQFWWMYYKKVTLKCSANKWSHQWRCIWTEWMLTGSVSCMSVSVQSWVCFRGWITQSFPVVVRIQWPVVPAQWRGWSPPLSAAAGSWRSSSHPGSNSSPSEIRIS